MKRANIPTKDALTLVKFEIIGFILSPNVFNFIVYEKMKKQYLSPPNVPYDLYQLQYIRITCMQLVLYLWGTCGVFCWDLWGTCGYIQIGLHLPFIRCMNM